MAFNINEMLSTINAVGGLSKASKFMVMISPPNQLSGDIDNDFTFLCDTAVLPGISFQTDEIRMSGYGNIEKRPYSPIFQDVNLTFFNDINGKVLSFFHKWVQSIYNFNSSTNPNATARGLISNVFGYPNGTTGGELDGYYGIVNIIHYNEKEEKIITYQLHEAYPITVGDVQVDWAQSDTLIRIPVTFAYTYWTAESLDPGQVDATSSARANALSAQATRVSQRIGSITELLQTSSPVQIQRYANRLINF